jgi:hypothetical protein
MRRQDRFSTSPDGFIHRPLSSRSSISPLCEGDLTLDEKASQDGSESGSGTDDSSGSSDDDDDEAGDDSSDDDLELDETADIEVEICEGPEFPVPSTLPASAAACVAMPADRSHLETPQSKTLSSGRTPSSSAVKCGASLTQFEISQKADRAVESLIRMVKLAVFHLFESLNRLSFRRLLLSG